MTMMKILFGAHKPVYNAVVGEAHIIIHGMVGLQLNYVKQIHFTLGWLVKCWAAHSAQ